MAMDVSASASSVFQHVTPAETYLQQTVSAGGESSWIVRTGKPYQVSARGLSIDQQTEREFSALANQWRIETRQLSSDSDIAGKFSYHQIIGMGESVLPLILRDLQEHGGRWYWALRAITRQNPVRAEDKGNTRRMTEAWLQWGRDRGYVR